MTKYENDEKTNSTRHTTQNNENKRLINTNRGSQERISSHVVQVNTYSLISLIRWAEFEKKMTGLWL